MGSNSEHSEEPTANTIEEITTGESKKLFYWNLGLGVLHLVTGIVLLVLTDQNATIPVYSFFSDQDTRESPVWEADPKLHGDFAVGYWSGISILLSSLDHLLVATVFRKTYEHYLARKRNPFRWIEYAFSASIMHVMIGQLSGIFSVHLLYTVFGLSMVTMVFGDEQEIANQDYMLGAKGSESMTFRPFWYGCIPHVYAWSIIFCFFFQGVSNADAPNFVWSIVFILFILDATFPINQFLQQKQIGKWRSYIFGEIAFCVLSLVAKQLLAWINFGGQRGL